MTQDEHWEQHYEAFLSFLTEQKRRPSKYRLEERQMLHWFKYQKKRLARNRFKPERMEKFQKLMELAQRYLRTNQYLYTNPIEAGDRFCGDLFADQE